MGMAYDWSIGRVKLSCSEYKLCLIFVFKDTPHLKYLQILFENRKRGDIGNDCLLSVDGTDCRLAMKCTDKFHSYKFKKAAARYEVALCIRTGDICWWHGPFEAGMWNDNMIFQSALAHMLEEGERVEADAGYKHSAPRYVKCPKIVTSETDPEKIRLQGRVRTRHETVNKRLKQFKVLKKPFRGTLIQHQKCFAAVVALTQLCFENGEPLFPVEYQDNY